MSWLSSLSLPLVWLVLHCSVLVILAAASNSLLFCSRNIYGSPIPEDCSHALTALPQAENYFRYYVEPQLETTGPDFDWEGWADERPPDIRRGVVQIPKFWSFGKRA